MSFLDKLDDITREAGMTEATNIQEDVKAKAATPKSRQEFEALEPGSLFVDPQGEMRRKPFAPKSRQEFEKVPEGLPFLDPTGEVREKPRFESIGFTAQTLYDMAVNDKERRNALEHSYPGQVREEAGELYVEDEGGVRRKPGHGVAAAGGAVAAAAAPTVLGALGALGGASTVAGTAAGGFAGAAAGQGINDLILGIAGVYDRSGGEEFATLGKSAIAGTAGAGVGRGIAAIPGVKSAAGALTGQLPAAVANILGTTPELAERASRLASQGVKVPPSAWAPEAPYLRKVVEQFDPAFRQQDVLFQSATEHYESTAGQLLDQLGVTRQEPLTAATAKVSSEPVGQQVIGRMRQEMQKADGQLEQEMVRARDTVRNVAEFETIPAWRDQVARLEQTQERSRAAAQEAIDEGFTGIQRAINRTVRAQETGENPGDLMREAATAIRGQRAATMSRAKILYDAGDAAAGDARPNLGALPERAQAMLERLPEDFRRKYPDVVEKISGLSGRFDETTGTWAKEPERPTFGQLRQLRSLLRHEVDYNDLTPGMRDGAYKYFASGVDEVLHDAEAVPELKTAAKMLDRADAFYAKNMPKFRDQTVQAIVSGIQAGLPADPQVLAKLVFREGYAERRAAIKKLVGPGLWTSMRAADRQVMLDAAKTTVPGKLDGLKFVKQVEDRIKNGIFDDVYTAQMRQKLLQQAQRVQMVEGKLPISVNPDDTVAQMLAKAEAAAADIERLAQVNPIEALSRELKQIDKDHAAALKAAQETRREEPLGFLYEPTALAVRSADRILESEDLIMAAAARFGEQSPEFEALRKTYVHRLLQSEKRGAEPSVHQLSRKISQIDPQIQRLLLPGVALDDLKQIASDMDFLLGRRFEDVGGSMAAASRVLHPWSSIPSRSFIVNELRSLPGADFVARLTLGKFYKLISDGATHPAFINWVAKGLRGAPAQRQQVRQAVQDSMRAGGAAGAGAAEAAYQESGGQPRRGRDGRLYVPDPSRPGKYLRVDTLH